MGKNKRAGRGGGPGRTNLEKEGEGEGQPGKQHPQVAGRDRKGGRKEANHVCPKPVRAKGREEK